MDRILNWAVVGCGVISSNHLDAIEALPNARVYAVCDLDEEKAKKAQEKYHAEKIYLDYNCLVADPEVDVVSVCTPSGAHGEVAIAAAEHKKHLFVEKPLEVTGEKMTALIDAVERNNVKLECVFQRRTYPEAVAAKKFIEEHDLGPIIYAEARLKYYRSQEYYDSGDWRATWELDGGGALMNQGVHGVDLLHWFVGEPLNVYALCKTMAHDIQVEDAAAAIVEFKNGAIGVIRATTCVYPGEETEITLHFKEGTLAFGDKGITRCEFMDKSIVAPEVKPISFNIKADPAAIGSLTHLAQAQDLADAILNDRPTAVDPRDARKSVDLILGIYESSRTKKLVWLDK